jgi:hypothetical protein
MNTLRTTIDLPSPVLRDIKIRAAQAGVSMKTLLTQWIENALRASPNEADLSNASKVAKPHPMPSFVRPRKAKAPLQATLSNAQLHALMDDEQVLRLVSANSQSKSLIKPLAKPR